MPTLFGTSSKCPRMRASLAIHARESSGEDTSTASRALSVSLSWRRVSLMLITMLVAATGAHRTLLQRLLGGWAFALAFRREAFACLDVAHSAAASLAPSRRCRVRGALIDELLLITGPAPLLETNLRAEPCEKLYAADASPDGAGGCAASITQDDWLLLYDLAEETEEHVRLDGKGEEAPSNMHDGRAAAARIAMKLQG